MSKNHPHDNIYSILGKLEALKPTPEETRMSLVKEIQRTVEAQGSIIEGVDAVQARLAKQFAESVDEVAPPGAKAERMVKGIKKSLSKDGHLSGKDKAIAYATTWKAHNKGQVEEATCNECGMYESKCACPHTNEDMSRAAKGYEKYGKKGMQALSKAGRDGAGEKELDKIRDQHDQYNEAETTHTGGEKVTTNKGTIHKSKATVDTEKDVMTGKLTDPDADDAPTASAEKKGRGRPKMADKDRSQASLPWGGKPPKDTYKHQKGSFVHKIAESRIVDESGETLDHVLNRFKFEVKQFEQGGELDQDLYEALFDYYCDSGEMPYGTAKARTGDPYEWVAQNLESHLSGGGIVGGNQEEDPMLTREAGIPGNIPAEQIPGKEDLLRGKGRSYYEEEVTMEDELNELARLAGLNTTEGNAFTGKLANTPKGGEFELDGKKFKDTSSLGETDLEEEETDEGNAFSGAVAKAKADGVQPGEKIEVDGKTYPVKESIESGESHPQGDFNINTSMSSNGDKNVTVTATGDHAGELLQMLRIAGLGGGAKAQELQPQMTQEPEVIVIDEPEKEVVADEGAELANDPEPQYMSMRGSTMGPGEGDAGEKQMNPDRPTFHNGDNALSNPPARGKDVLKAVAALESKLAAEYESIKKISK